MNNRIENKIRLENLENNTNLLVSILCDLQEINSINSIRHNVSTCKQVVTTICNQITTLKENI